ncbi:hypothetical protein [Bradyrhizobium sp. 186]|uniref:hypothetical protein n=1 Tax=Bradyrhizobium sp. 186 TaxID=2782654 RepID=UPI0020008ED2|nr:hypothetical protein [Bradyrhizobium sp. 186]
MESSSHPSRRVSTGASPRSSPISGGAAGFFAYDLNRTSERLPPPEIAGQGLPQSILHFYDVVIAYDHRDERCWIFLTGWPEQDPARRGERAPSSR